MSMNVISNEIMVIMPAATAVETALRPMSGRHVVIVCVSHRLSA